MLVVDWYLLHDRQYGAAGGSFVVTHAAALAALLDAALITNVGGRGALSAVATAHVVLLCASEHNASVLRAALVHALVVLIGGGLLFGAAGQVLAPARRPRQLPRAPPVRDDVGRRPQQLRC